MRQFALLLFAGCGMSFWAASAHADDEKKKTPDPRLKIIDAFVQHLKADTSLKAGVRDAALKKVAEARKDESGPDYAITDALRVASKEFAKGVALLGDENFKAAIEQFTPLAKSKNPYLAAEASYFIARAVILQENYERAIPHLEKLTGEFAAKTVRAGEALFLKGMSQLHLLKRKEAAKSLAAFLAKHKHAPERLRIAAWRQLEALRSIEQGSLADVHYHMLFSRRRLSLKDSGKRTRNAQDRIVAMLDKMIKDIEKKGGS